MDAATLSPPSPRPGETVRIRVTLKNIGQRSLSGAISVTAKPDRGRMPKAATVRDLKAGASHRVAIPYRVPPAAKHGDRICFKVSVHAPAEAPTLRGNNVYPKPLCLTVRAPAPPPPRTLPGKTRRIEPEGTVPRGPRLPRLPDVEISGVRPDPKTSTVFPPRGVLSLHVTVANRGKEKAGRVKLALSLARKPRSGSPVWKAPGSFHFRARERVRIGEIPAGGRERVEIAIRTTERTVPGRYLYRLVAIAPEETSKGNNHTIGEFRVGYRTLPEKLVQALKNQGKDPESIRWPPWVIRPGFPPVDPSGGGLLPVESGDGWKEWRTLGAARIPDAAASRDAAPVPSGSEGGVPVPRFVPNRVVLFAMPREGQDAKALLQAVAERFALSPVALVRLESVGAVMGLYKITGRRGVQDVVRRIQKDGRVQAQPNHLFEALAADPRAELQYGLAMLGIPRLRGRLTGRGVKVAILDTGVDTRHEDLAGRVIAYRDLVTGESEPTPDLHGTAVAGIIAALAGNGKGGAGVAPGASLVVIKVIRPESPRALEGTSTTFRIARGLDAAMVSGARVINLSLGGPEDRIVGHLVDAALEKGIVVVAAAGNGGPRGAPPYPATHPGVIAVTAIDKRARLYPAATRGEHIALAAPGVEVFTTAPGDRYRLVSGTSFAAAHVSAVAALLLEHAPWLSARRIREALIAGAVDLGPEGKDPLTGHGRLDACLAVRAVGKGDPCGPEP